MLPWCQFHQIFRIYNYIVYTYMSEKAMATHSSTLAWKIPWTEEPGGLQSMGSLRVGHDWATSLSLFTFHFHALEKEMATYFSVLAWRISGTGEPGGLPSMGSHRVGHDWSDLAAAYIHVYISYPYTDTNEHTYICVCASYWLINQLIDWCGTFPPGVCFGFLL